MGLPRVASWLAAGVLALASASSAYAADGADWLPVTGGSVQIGCTWSNGCSGGYHGYAAIDFMVPNGSPVFAAGAGTVTSYGGCPNARNDGCNDGAGNYIRINHGARVSRYLHLSAIVVGSGSVQPGQLIGYSGTSGYSTAYHLHYDELVGGSKVDPGTLNACHGASTVSYGGWAGRAAFTSFVRNDGYGCMGNNPIGWLDVAQGRPGSVRVAGWAADRDNTAAAISVHIYVGGHAGQAGAEGFAIGTGVSRPDVHTALGIGSNHGFDSVLTTSKRGSQLVCAYGINIGGGQNVELGCKTVTITDPNPVGWFDSVSSPVGGKVRVRGWMYDPNAPSATGTMHVYVGGTSGTAGAEGHAFTANASRPDVDAVYHTGTNHGLDVTFSTAKRGVQTVCLYGINVGPGANVSYGCKSVTIADPPVVQPPPPPSGIVWSGTSGADVKFGTAYADVLRGRGGNDRLYGTAGADRLFGGGGADRVEGGKGADAINGGRGRDVILGGAGNDLIDVRDGVKDTVYCGSGTDRVNADPIDRLVGCEQRTNTRVV